MLSSIFEFLFKFRPNSFARGDLTFAASRSLVLLAIVALLAAVPGLLLYQRVKGRSTARDRAILMALRIGTVVILLVCMLRPILVISEAIPQRNAVGIVLDDSRSMAITDEGGRPRGEALKAAFAPDSPLMKELTDKFLVRFFRFSKSTDRLEDVTGLTFTGGETHLGTALEHSREDLSSVPLSGLVVVSDGADNSGTPLTEELLALRAHSVPVFTVGVGQERFAKDIEITRVDMPRNALKGASLMVDLLISQNGYRGQKAQLQVEDAGRIVSTQELTMPQDGEVTPVHVQVQAADVGARVFKFRILPQPGEVVTQNNEREALVNVSNRREKVLYYEGEPRWEFKFIRRAVEEDPNLQLVMLLRDADKKYYRVNVDSGGELVGGFPTTRKELFSYKAIILGSTAANLFTNDQLKMLADFVSERGGALLMLGGWSAFSEGGYAGTPLADVLPVILGPATNRTDEEGFFTWLKVHVTPAGRGHPVTQFGATEAASVEKLATLPELSAVNRVTELKPGATALLTGTPTRGRGDDQIVLAYQRYGRGTAAAMPVQDTWMWQMGADVAVDDLTYETLWRQMLRWLVNEVPGRVNVTVANDRVNVGESVVLRGDVSDENFVRMNNATVTAHISSPTGVVQDLPLEWTVDRDGEYRASFSAAEQGVYAVVVQGKQGETVIAADTTFIKAGELNSEYFDARLHSTLLKRVADETGGTYYTLNDLSHLPEDLTYSRSGAAVVQQLDLWDMPIIFLVLIALVAAEWGYRKQRGLA